MRIPQLSISDRMHPSSSTIRVVASAGLAATILVGLSTDLFALSNADTQALLNTHNAYRAKHCVPNLTWSAQLAAQAQAWADKCPSTGFKHSGGVPGQPPYGENLAWGTNRSAKNTVDSWYGEISSYNFNAPKYSNAVGHFTQVVWRDSKQLGCGMSVCQGQNYWVCQYSPPGNWNVDNPGVLAANVPAICVAGGGTPPAPPTPPTPPADGGGGGKPPAAGRGEWSGFAASPKGYWGYGVHQATQQQAGDLAFNGCGGAKNGCKTFWTTKDKCVSFAESRQNGYWYAAGGGNDQNQAKANAIRFCQRGTAPANSCKSTGVWCR
jgi:uncharacterized protein YkwD